MNISTVADMGMPTQSSDPPLKKSKIETQPSKVYLLYSSHDSYGYKLYALDPSALGNWNGNPEEKIETLQPVLELPGLKYPMGMDAFAVGSTLYMIGGEIPLETMDMIGGETPLENMDMIGAEIPLENMDMIGGETPFNMDKMFLSSRLLSPSVYMCDTTALPLSVVEGPRMKGGKAAPFVIPVDNLIYVISDVPALCTTFYTDKDETVLFEVFDPNEGSWSSLPHPPFYPRPDHCDMEPDFSTCSILTCSIVNYAVVDSRIFFCTHNKTRMYAFHVHDHKWETFDLLRTENLFPFDGLAMSISDSAWISVGSGDSNSPLTTYNLASNLGLVRRTVEGLSSLVHCRPYLDFYSDYRLLDFKNGWFCLLICGMEMDYFSGVNPHPHALASVFRLVKKHTDEVYLHEVRPWVSHRKLDPKAIEAAGLPMPHLHDLYDVFSVDMRVGSSKDHFDPEKRVGEVQVFGAEDLRGSLFAVGDDKSTRMPYLIAAFLV